MKQVYPGVVADVSVYVHMFLLAFTSLCHNVVMFHLFMHNKTGVKCKIPRVCKLMILGRTVQHTITILRSVHSRGDRASFLACYVTSKIASNRSLS